MRRLLHLLTCLFAYLVMGYSQVFGVYHNYVVEVEGAQVVTAVDHQHKGVTLEPNHLDEVSAHSHSEQSDDRDTVPNEPLKVDLSAPQLQFAPLCPPVAFLQVCELSDFLLNLLKIGIGFEKLEAFASEANAPEVASETTAIVVADCMVMRM